MHYSRQVIARDWNITNFTNEHGKWISWIDYYYAIICICAYAKESHTLCQSISIIIYLAASLRFLYHTYDFIKLPVLVKFILDVSWPFNMIIYCTLAYGPINIFTQYNLNFEYLNLMIWQLRCGFIARVIFGICRPIYKIEFLFV